MRLKALGALVVCSHWREVVVPLVPLLLTMMFPCASCFATYYIGGGDSVIALL